MSNQENQTELPEEVKTQLSEMSDKEVQIRILNNLRSMNKRIRSINSSNNTILVFEVITAILLFVLIIQIGYSALGKTINFWWVWTTKKETIKFVI